MLKHFSSTGRLNTRLIFKTSLAFIISVSLTLACGKRTPPQPPVERISQRAELSGVQQGKRIILRWALPARNASESDVNNLSRADIYRLVEPLGSPQTVTEEEFASRSTLIASVPITPETFKHSSLSYTDTLEFAGQPARIRYAVRFVNASGQKAGFSNFFLIEPTARVAEKPSLETTSVTQEKILLQWRAPLSNVDGTQPANILGYNVYRIDQANPNGRLLNASPVTKTSYDDEFFEFEKEYGYFVRAVSLGTSGQPIESENSEILTVKPSDTFPPAAPDSLTIAATPTSISIFFAANPEKDIAGYRVFRTENRETPLANWRLMTQELLQTNTFQDTQVEPGKTYFYYVTAVDKFGNTSQPSEIVSETVP